MKILKMNLTRWIILLISCYTTTTWPVLIIDRSFGNNGNGTIEVAQMVQGIDFQSDSKIITFSTEGLSRYDTNGSLDVTFGRGNTGIVRLRQPLTNDFKMSVKVQQPDNTITTVALENPNGARTAECHLKHYNENGLKIISRSDAFLTWIRHLTNTPTLIPLPHGDRILEIHHVAIQSDGKIIVVGVIGVGAGNYGFMARYNQDRTLDNTFGSNGTGIIINYARRSFDLVTIQSDGKIIVASTTFSLRPYSLTNSLIRYTSNGVIDTSFGTDGNGIPYERGCIKSIATHNHKILVAVEHYGERQKRLQIEQYNADATADTDFGPNGVGINLNISRDYKYSSIALQPNGNILMIMHRWVYGSRNYSSSIMKLRPLSPTEIAEQERLVALKIEEEREFERERILAAAALTTEPIRLNMIPDQSFGTNGIVRGKIGERFTALIQSNGKLIIARNFHDHHYQFGFVCYNTSDGSLDETFDTQAIGKNSIASLAVQQDDQFIAAITYAGKNNPFLYRYKSNGLLDKSFISLQSPDNCRISSLVLQPDKKIIVAGGEYGKGVTYLARYNSNGSLDESFKPQPHNGHIQNLLLQPNGKIVTYRYYSYQEGVSYDSHSVYGSSLSRFNRDGSPDKTFQESSVEGLYSLALQKNSNQLLIARIIKNNYSISRLNQNGTLDSSFYSDKINANAIPALTIPIVKVLSNGKILFLIGSIMACYNHNGRPDTTFSFNQTHLLPLPDNVQGSDFLFDSDTQTLTIIGEETSPCRRPIILRYRASSPEEATEYKKSVALKVAEEKRIAELEKARLTRDQALKKQQDFELTVKRRIEKFEDKCPICYEDSVTYPTDTQLSCGHTFHSDCIRKCGNNPCPMCRSPREGSKMRVVVEQEITQERAAIAEALTAAEARLVELEAVNSALEAERLLAADLARVAQSGATVAIAHPEVTQTPAETEPRQHGAAALTPAERRELMRNAAEERLKKEREEAAAAQRAAAVGTTDARGAAAGATAEDRARAAAVVTQETGAAAADPVDVAERVVEEGFISWV